MLLTNRNLISFDGINLEGVEFLWCYDNKLTSLPELPSTLKILHCDNNKLNELPELSSTLTVLYCNNNNINKLPELPSTLELLSCDGNNLPYSNLEEYKKYKNRIKKFERILK